MQGWIIVSGECIRKCGVGVRKGVTSVACVRKGVVSVVRVLQV